MFAILCVLFFLDKFVMYNVPGKINLNGWIGLFYAVVAWAAIWTCPVLLLGRRAYPLYAVALPVEIVLVCVEWFTRTHFDMILTGSWVGIAMSSSWDEVTWFLSYYRTEFIASAVGLLALIAALLYCFRCVKKAVVTRWTFGVCVAGLLALFGTSHVIGFSLWGMPRGFSVPSLVMGSFRHYQYWKELAQMVKKPKLPATIRSTQEERPAALGVFVLGESVTRNHWRLYGYPRETTPEMVALTNDLVVFSDMVSIDGQTSDSMRSIFTTRTAENWFDVRWAMPQALRKAGTMPCVYSNQKRWAACDSSDEVFSFAGCHPFLCMAEADETNKYDNVLLKYLDRELVRSEDNSFASNSVVFLHLYGSHYHFANRYPHAGAPFGTQTPNGLDATEIDHYDNSIWFTDKILGEVVRRLKALHKPAWMIYLSDHGETPSSRGWRMATDNDCWEVPFVVWTSPEFDAAYPERVAALRRAKDKPLQSDQLLYGLLRFMGVEGLGNAPEEDFLSDAFRPREPRLILGGTTAYQPTAR